MDGDLARLAAAQGGFVYRWQALECGYREREIARLLHAKVWRPIRRGAYALSAEFDRLDPVGRHALVTRAVMGSLQGVVVATGYSALALRRVPMWGVDLTQVHVIREAGRSARTDAGVVHHEGLPQDRDVELLDGRLVARPELALAQAARVVSFEAGVVLGDGVLRLCRPDTDRLTELVRDEQRDWRGASSAGRILAFADGDAETVGESRSRVMLARLGLPAPYLQRTFCRPDGQVYARVDFWFDDHVTVGEFDGRQKYGRALYERTGSLQEVDLGEVVWSEKRREDELRADGAEVVRWVWHELDGHDALMLARFEAAFRRARRPA